MAALMVGCAGAEPFCVRLGFTFGVRGAVVFRAVLLREYQGERHTYSDGRGPAGKVIEEDDQFTDPCLFRPLTLRRADWIARFPEGAST